MLISTFLSVRKTILKQIGKNINEVWKQLVDTVVKDRCCETVSHMMQACFPVPKGRHGVSNKQSGSNDQV